MKMSTPWTMTLFNRWRVRNWVSCFLALGDEPNTSPSSKLPIRSIGFEMEGGTRGHGNKLSRRNGSRKEGFLNHQGGGSGLSVLVERKDSDSSWPHFQDEDYIVFCFKEDGAFDVVKDFKPEALERLDSANKTPRPVNRKLNYGEVTETKSDSSREKRPNDDSEEVDEELESNKSETEPPSGVRTRRYQIEDVEYDRSLSVKSNDSNRSDGSTGSFSFPRLQMELMGSPVHMPKSEAMQGRRNKISYARFQCCRF